MNGRHRHPDVFNNAHEVEEEDKSDSDDDDDALAFATQKEEFVSVSPTLNIENAEKEFQLHEITRWK